jgi:tRNA threonylcarbamoyladenosine biosynthesis protein TsaB
MIDLLPLLAIETSDNICSACVYYNDEKYFSSKVILKHSHAEKLFGTIESVINQAETSFTEIKAVAVSSGPGSFTGLRIGMSAAKGIAQASGLSIIPVPTFHALALQISNYLPENSQFIIANKVGRDELYYAKFQIKSNSFIFQQELKIIHISQLQSLSKDCLIFGNVDFENINKNSDFKNISAPDSEYVAKWAAYFGENNINKDIDFLEPNYLKDFIIKEKKL